MLIPRSTKSHKCICFDDRYFLCGFRVGERQKPFPRPSPPTASKWALPIDFALRHTVSFRRWRIATYRSRPRVRCSISSPSFFRGEIHRELPPYWDVLR